MIKRTSWCHIKKTLLNIHQSFLMVALATGIIVGVVVGIIFRINYFASPIWVGLVTILFIIAYWKSNIVFAILMLIAGMILAFFRISSELSNQKYMQSFYDQTVVVSGRVEGDPETDEKGTRFKLSNLEFGEENTTTGKIYITVTKNEDLARSDLVTLNGKLLSGFGVYSGYLYKPSIIKWSRPEPGDLILKTRNWFANRTRRLIPTTEANLGLSYLLGMKTGLSDELEENLRTVGLVHIVVASGAHLSILVEVARKIFGKISRLTGLAFSILFILFFMSMVGWTPSIMRAGIMTIITLVTWYSGRKIAPWRMIIMVAAFTLMMDPMFVIDLGWLLSFASYGGIMILGPKLTKFLYGEKKPGAISSFALTTISATLMTLPITLYHYGMISLISVIANLLILPTLPYAMGLVFLTGIVAGMPLVEMLVSVLTTKMLDYHILVIEFFGKMNELMIGIPQFQSWVFGVYGIIIIFLLIGLIKRKVVKLRQVEYKF